MGLAATMLVACAQHPLAEPAVANPSIADDCSRVAADYQRWIGRSPARSRYGQAMPGRPWFRVMRGWDRWPMAETPGARRAWLAAAATLARQAITAEIGNRPQARVAGLLDRLEACAARDIDRFATRDVDGWRALRRSARVPDDYRDWQRWLGAYPVAAWGLRRGIADWRGAFAQDYGRPPDEPLRRWAPALDGADALARRLHAQWPALPGSELPDPATLADWLIRHAPTWLLGAADANDVPGWPAWRGEQLVLDVGRPHVSVQALPALFDTRPHLQLIYTVWFAGRAPAGPWDPYAGALDGVVWRVTLDGRGQVVMRDAMHPCGCYHMVFPPDATTRADPTLPEPALIPESVVGDAPLTVAVRAGDHQIVDVQAGREPADAHYRLRAYTDLLSLPVVGGGGARRSLFDADGLVGASARGERWFLWPSGVVSPGAMRIWGHHPVAFVGRRHANDPDLFDRLLINSPAE